MKDGVFYPLVAAIAAAIIVFALTRGETRERIDREDVLRDGYVLSGAGLIDLTASPGTELVVGEASTRAVMVEDRASAPPSAGIFATLAPVHEDAFGGREIELVWRLRRPDGPGEVEIGYFTLGAGDSGWMRRSVGTGWTDVSMTFAPDIPEGEGFDYAGLWPGVGDPDGMPVEIESVSVRLAD